MASAPVLATKLFAPARRAQLVARPRLAGRLDATRTPGHRLTLVSAPAGFGKTTLIGEWLAHLEPGPDGAGLAWLSLDEGDNDLDRLLAHLVAALRRAGLDVGGAALESQPAAVLTALVNDVTGAGGQAVLVLDDYHVIDSADVHEAVTFLLDNLPGNLQLVIATRADPPLPLARLRSRGQLTELRAADLRFTAGEAGEFLQRVMGLELTPAEVGALEDRTEGWVAGLQLAALSLRGIAGRGDVDGFIAAFTGSNRFVIDYLADEVLARQPVAVREFLLRTAVLDRFTGSLCDAVTGRADGARSLAELERDNLFLVALDEDRSWYRYHHLFADVLRARLLAEQPELVARLHRSASDWHADHDFPADAVRHAVAAGDPARAAYLMEQALPEVRRTRQDGLLLAWMRMLPAAVVRRSPVLSVVGAFALMVSGDLDGAEARLDDAERALAAGDPAGTWADTDELRTAPATILIYRASLAQARGDVAGTVRHARLALELAGPADHLVRGAACGFLGLAAWSAGDVGAALSTFGEAVRSLRAAGNLVDELDGTIVLADLWVAAGRPSRARRLYEQALLAATADGPPYPRATADLHVGLAELDRELDDLAGAEAHLETARVLGERASITENRHRWPVAMAQVRAAAGDYEAATRLLDRAAATYRHGFYPDVRPIAAMRARVRIAAGDLPAAIAWADEHGAAAEDYLHEYEQLTVVRLRLAQGRPVGGLLDRLHTAAAAAGRDGSLLEIRTLQALALAAEGDRPRALAVLAHSRAEAPEPESYLRLYLDEGDPMRALRGQPEMVSPLSPREHEVLRLLDGELTGPEIARRLFVSVNTLRTHT